jgi:hypothetical protein
MLTTVHHSLWASLAYPTTALDFENHASVFCREFEDLGNPLSEEILKKIAWAFKTALPKLRGFPMKIFLNNRDIQTYDKIREKISSFGQSELHQAACEAIAAYQKEFTCQRDISPMSTPPILSFRQPLTPSESFEIPPPVLQAQQPSITNVPDAKPPVLPVQKLSLWVKGLVILLVVVLYKLLYRPTAKAP